MKKLIAWIKEYSDYLTFPLLGIDVALLWLFAYALGAR